MRRCVGFLVAAFLALPVLASEVVIEPSGCDSTARIQAAIDAAFVANGGKVTLAGGVHDVRSLRLRSRVELHLRAGAVLRGSRIPEDYDGMIASDSIEPFAGARCAVSDKFAATSTNHWNNAIIRIYGAHDAAVTGDPGSVIDGRNCYDPKGEERFRGPHGISVHFSTNLVFAGYELRNAGNWSHRICLSADVCVDGVSVRGGHDGLDFHACDRVSVKNCDLQTGDDCIAGYDIRGLTVRNCRLNTACSAFRLGGRDILVEDVTVTAPAVFCHRRTLPDADKVDGANPVDRGRRTSLSFFTYYGSPRARGPSANVAFRRCRVTGVERLVHYNFSGSEWWQSGQPLEDVAFEDVVATGLKFPLHVYAPENSSLALVFRRCCLGFADSQKEFAKGANVGTVVADGLEVKNVRGPFLRTWNGVPDFKTSDLKGVEAHTEEAAMPFKVDPV